MATVSSISAADYDSKDASRTIDISGINKILPIAHAFVAGTVLVSAPKTTSLYPEPKTRGSSI